MTEEVKRTGIKAWLRLSGLPLSLALAFSAQAASFDCGKATTRVEKLVCSNQKLSIMDEDLASAYSETLKHSADPAILKKEQRAWLKNRNQCNDSPCLGEQYRQRLAVLNQELTGFPTNYPADISEFEVDCGKPRSLAEKIICKQADDYLSQQSLASRHKEMRPVLQWTLMRSKDKKKAMEAQRKWQKEVRDACNDSTCCVQAYYNRDKELRATWARPGQCYVLRPSAVQGRLQVESDGNMKTIEPVCLAMEENLNQFCEQPPMVCGLQVAPRFREQITFPDWSPLDPKANLELIEEFIRAPWEGVGYDPKAPQRIWESERPEIEAALAAGRLSFSQAQLDLYDLGKTQLAYRLDYGTCAADNQHLADPKRWHSPLKSAPVDIQQAPAVIRQLSTKYDAGGSPANETFLYGGQTYTFVMGEGEGAYGNDLLINRHERWVNPSGTPKTKVSLSMDNICQFNYRPLYINQEATK